ncbi:MAG: hypothetical protein R2856_02515 [Caldilineaceae bacterium]
MITAVYILYRIIQNVFLGEYDAERHDHWTTVDGSTPTAPPMSPPSSR